MRLYAKMAGYAWIGVFGVWPLAHPEHTTWSDPLTWADWMLHAMGVAFYIGFIGGFIAELRRLAYWTRRRRRSPRARASIAAADIGDVRELQPQAPQRRS